VDFKGSQKDKKVMETLEQVRKKAFSYKLLGFYNVK
jgi:prephenate dehydratase